VRSGNFGRKPDSQEFVGRMRSLGIGSYGVGRGGTRSIHLAYTFSPPKQTLSDPGAHGRLRGMTTAPDFIPSPNPNNLQVYDIVSIDRIDDEYGYWWIEARTRCGHTIAVAGPESFGTGTYGVVISIGVGFAYRSLRHYSGGEGSDAERVFKSFFGALDASPETPDTTSTR
jgi:hypothetical protein